MVKNGKPEVALKTVTPGHWYNKFVMDMDEATRLKKQTDEGL